MCNQFSRISERTAADRWFLSYSEVHWWCDRRLVLSVLTSKASSDGIRARVSACVEDPVIQKRIEQWLNHSWTYSREIDFRLISAEGLAPARGTDAPAKICKDLPCCGLLRCSGRYEACVVFVLTAPDVVIRRLLYLPFRETEFCRRCQCCATNVCQCNDGPKC